MDSRLRRRLPPSYLIIIAAVALVGVSLAAQTRTASGKPVASRAEGNPTAGRDGFRFETFGNEGFWSDALRMPQGVLDAKLTPLQALEAGLLVGH